jgi:hypothetical protein
MVFSYLGGFHEEKGDLVQAESAYRQAIRLQPSFSLPFARLAEHWRSALPVVVHEVNYEETVTNLDGVARRLVAACGLDWNPSCLQPRLNRRNVRTASLAQVRRPVYRDSLGRWKHYENELADLFAALPESQEASQRS